MADNLTTFIHLLSSNLGASVSWNPQGLSRPVMGLLYLFFVHDNSRTKLRIGGKCPHWVCLSEKGGKVEDIWTSQSN